MSQTYDTDTTSTESESRAAPTHTEDLASRPPDLGSASPALPDVAVNDASEPGVVLLENADHFRGRWEHIQSDFVDEPRRAVEQADALVAEVITTLADSFSKEQQRLEGQWSSGDNVSTDDLRIALQRYRSFFQRLLSS